MSAFAAWLMGFARSFLHWLYNNTIDLIQGAIDGFAAFCLIVIQLFPAAETLPSNPYTVPASSTWDTFICALNWLFPVSYLVTLMIFSTAALVAYFVIAPLARWVKLLT